MMKLIALAVMRILRVIRRSLMLIVLIVSVWLNIAFVLSDTFITAASQFVSTVSGTRSMMLRQADDILMLERQLEASRQAERRLQSELLTSRTARREMQEATAEVAARIGRRHSVAAARELAVMPAETIPFWGAAIIVTATAIELKELCDTLIDMTDLQQRFSNDVAESYDQLTVCSMNVPSRDDIWQSARTTPGAVWSSAQDAMPSMNDIKNMQLPEVDWADLGESISETASDWSGTAAGAVGGKIDQLKAWWNN
jgi:hypothetical protein